MIYELILKGLNEDFKKLYQTELKKLLEHAPSDASLTSMIKPQASGYRGLLVIFSSVGRFVARGLDQDPVSLSENLIRQIFEQIEGWHKTRALTA